MDTRMITPKSCDVVAADAFGEGIHEVVTCELLRTVSTLKRCVPYTLSHDTFPHDLTSVLQRAASRHDVNLGTARSAYVRNRQLLGMNGQLIKASILLHIMRRLCFDCFVETGTKSGFTSLLVLAHTQLPVLTCEIDSSRFRAAGTLLKPFGDRCKIYLEDKCEFLKHVLQDERLTVPFFYLDAQGPEMTLNDELTAILSSTRLREFVVVIDDFKVPWDAGFVYDKYPSGDVNMRLIENTLQLSPTKVVTMCPSYQASVETGYPAGFVVICPIGMRRELEMLVPSNLLQAVP